MQRVRIGITGLAVVFLLVLLTAALLGTLRRQGAEAPAVAAAASGKTQEPLAELGVAPGATPPAQAAPTPVAAPQPTPLLSPPAPKPARRPGR